MTLRKEPVIQCVETIELILPSTSTVQDTIREYTMEVPPGYAMLGNCVFSRNFAVCIAVVLIMSDGQFALYHARNILNLQSVNTTTDDDGNPVESIIPNEKKPTGHVKAAYIFKKSNVDGKPTNNRIKAHTEKAPELSLKLYTDSNPETESKPEIHLIDVEGDYNSVCYDASLNTIWLSAKEATLKQNPELKDDEWHLTTTKSTSIKISDKKRPTIDEIREQHEKVLSELNISLEKEAKKQEKPKRRSIFASLCGSDPEAQVRKSSHASSKPTM